MWCSNCGVSADKVRLFDAISPKGIIKICEKCSDEEGFPIVRRPTTFQLKESEKKPNVYNRLMDISGVKNKQYNPGKTDVEFKKQETSLKEMVDKNYREKIQKREMERKPRPDLVENFHWVIMRERRSRKITQEQLAKEISEAEAAIKLAEQGILPEDDYRFLRKIESFLGIRLIKDSSKIPSQNALLHAEESSKSPARVIKFDPELMKNITIDDLKRMKDARSSEDLIKDQDEGFIEVEEDEDFFMEDDK